MTTRSPVSARTPAPSAPRMRGFGTEGSPFRTQRSRWLSDAARSSTSTSPGPATGSGDVLVPEHLRAAVLVDPYRFHGRDTSVSHDSAAELTPAGRGARPRRVGAAPAGPYEETERHIRERKERGLFADDAASRRARPEESCHPEQLLAGRAHRRSRPRSATTPTSADPEPGEGRLPRYTWPDRYAELRERLDALGRAARRRATASSSTRTSTSTARARRAPASASTARTRC